MAWPALFATILIVITYGLVLLMELGKHFGTSRALKEE